jgi:tRNA-dihydrouridine synthase 3
MLYRCRFTHDVDAYLAAKPKDIRFPSITTISDVPPFIMDTEEDNSTADDNHCSLEQHTSCPSFTDSGFCRLGLKCRFLGAHAKRDASGVITLVEDEDKRAQTALSATELNFVSADTLKLLRSKKVSSGHKSFPLTSKLNRIAVSQANNRLIPPRTGGC